MNRTERSDAHVAELRAALRSEGVDDADLEALAEQAITHDQNGKLEILTPAGFMPIAVGLPNFLFNARPIAHEVADVSDAELDANLAAASIRANRG